MPINADQNSAIDPNVDQIRLALRGISDQGTVITNQVSEQTTVGNTPE